MANKAQSFRDLIVWQKAHAFTLALYRCTGAFPKHELFGLTAQMRRAAVSVPSNIVEGFRKRSRPDKLRYFNIAQGSTEESCYYLILAKDLEYGDVAGLTRLLEEVSKLLEAYSHAIRASES